MNKCSTIQRYLVLEAVKELRSHVTADEVYDTIVKKHPGISRGTVYRNLNVLSELGEIRKVEMPGGAGRYDHLCHGHYHAICIKCGQVFDVDMEFITDLERGIKDTHGFAFTGHDIIFKLKAFALNAVHNVFSGENSNSKAANLNMCAYGSMKNPVNILYKEKKP